MLAGDHGEGLGDHGEDEHGLLTYDSTLHVPWIVRLPGKRRQELVVSQKVSLVDVLPTMLDLVGAPVPTGIDGTSRAGLVRGWTSPRGDVLYAESQYPRIRFGWHELSVVRDDRFKLVRGRRTELFDYRADPGETTNIADREPQVVARLGARLDQLTADRAYGPAPSAMDPQTERQLRALGYTSGSAPSPLSQVDPRDKTTAYTALMRARTLLDQGQDRPAVDALERLVTDEPDLAQAHRTLREYWLVRGQLPQAAAWIQRQLALRPDDVRLLVDLAVVERASQRPAEALRLVDLALQRSPDDQEALVLSGELLRLLKRHQAALDRFTLADALSPTDSTIKMQMATTWLELGRPAEAESLLNDVLAADPHAATAHYLLAQIAESRGDAVRAATEYQVEIDERPWEERARFNLAMLLGRSGRHAEALALLESIPRLSPAFHDVQFFIAKEALDSGDVRRRPDAMAAAQRGLQLAPRSPNAPLGHYVLADLYRLTGRTREAEREIDLGRSLERELQPASGRGRPSGRPETITAKGGR
jgi:tetratricopeptide (TPR) repeat protein